MNFISTFRSNSRPELQMRLAWLPLSLILVPVITMSIVYPVAYYKGHTEGKIITYISDALDYPPEASIGAIGLSFTSFLFILFAHFRYNFINGAINSAEMTVRINTVMNTSNKASVLLAWIAGFGLIGLSVFRYHDTPAAHKNLTLVFFLPAVLYMYLQAFFDLSLKLSSRKLRALRLTGAIGSSAFTVLLLILIHFNNNDVIFTMCAVSEIMTVFLFLAVIASYCFDFSRIEWQFTVRHHGEYADGSPSSPLITRKA